MSERASGEHDELPRRPADATPPAACPQPSKRAQVPDLGHGRSNALSASQAIALQRTVGNAAVARLLSRTSGRRPLARFRQDLPDLGDGSFMTVSGLIKAWRPGESEHNRWFPASGDSGVSIPAGRTTVVQIYVSLHCHSETGPGELWQHATATWDVAADQYGALTIRPHGGPGAISLEPPSWNGPAGVPVQLRDIIAWPSTPEEATAAATDRRVTLVAVSSRGGVQTTQAADTTQTASTVGGRAGTSQTLSGGVSAGGQNASASEQTTGEVSGSHTTTTTHTQGPSVAITRPDVGFRAPFTLALWVTGARERPPAVPSPPRVPTRPQHLHIPVSELRFRGADGRLMFGGDRAVIPESDLAAGELDALNAWLRRLEGGPGWQSNLWAAIRAGMVTFQVRGHASRDGSVLGNNRYARARSQWVVGHLSSLFGGMNVAPRPEHRGQADPTHVAHARGDHSVEIWIDPNEAIRGIERWIGDPARLQQVPEGNPAPP